MNPSWAELILALYGLSYMVLGVSVAARAAAFPTSALRNRLFCLAAFSIGHAFYDWAALANDITPGLLPGKVRYTVEAISFMPLCFFATGWKGLHARLLQSALVVTALAGLSVVLFSENALYLQLVVHFGIGIPVGTSAVYALLRDPIFRPRPDASEFALKLAAYSLAVYTATQLIVTRGDYFPATVLGANNFEALFGFSPFALRVVCAFVFMSATLALLGRFDEAMRTEAEKDHGETRKALRVTEAKLADILSMSPEGIIIADGEGRIEMFSTGAEDIFGWRAEEIAGKNVEILMPERFRATHKKHIDDFVTSAVENWARNARSEVLGLRRNGEEFPLGASLSKIATPDGILVTTILRDISRNKAEQKELIDAKRHAEEASQAKSQFIANMSHELRTPLNAILGFSELLSVKGFENRREEYAKLIHVSGSHLLTLINDILDLAKIEAGKFTLRETVFDFGATLREVAGMLAEKAKGGGIAFTASVAPDLPLLHADERALKQVLLNLAANALKFTPSGGEVTLFAKIGAEGKFVFGVRDTGIGISEEDQARLFKNFGQGRQAALTGEKGSGLGLQIAKGLVLAHGGAIELQSRPREGTTVTVVLPANRVRAVEAAGAA